MTTAGPIHQKRAERRSHASSWKRHQSFVFRSPPLDRVGATSLVLWTFGDAEGHIHSCSGEFEQPCWHNLIKLGLKIRSLVSAKLDSWKLRQTTTRKLKTFAHGSARLKLVGKSYKNKSSCDTHVCTRTRVPQNPNEDLNHNLPNKLFKCKTHVSLKRQWCDSAEP